MSLTLGRVVLCALACGCSAELVEETPDPNATDAATTDVATADLPRGMDAISPLDVPTSDVPSARDVATDRGATVDLPSGVDRPGTDITAGDVSPMFPAFLHDGRTFDQERDFIAWEGPVNIVTLRHRDGTALPAGEGGASCGGGCDESVTRIANGGRIHGRFSYVQSFSVQLASTSDPGAGEAHVEVCGTALPTIILRGGTSPTPGFSNQPQPAFAVPTPGECQWSVRAVGGYVDLRAIDVHYRGGAPPTVDVRVDGMNGPVSYNALARYLVSWTSTSAARCTASGAWMGARDITGALGMTDIPAGTYAYTVTCENGGGSATDTVMVTVREPPQ